MTMRLTYLAFGAALATSACLSTGPTEVTIGAEFELAPNQSAKVIGTNWTVGFRGVTGDTRCPVDRLCLVAGDAGIRLDVFGSSADNPLVLSPNPPNDHWNDQDFRLRVIDLAPAPADDHAISPGDYRVRLVVEAVGS
jgi:hypothetical protein